jgi:hypothetical protein
MTSDEKMAVMKFMEKLAENDTHRFVSKNRKLMDALAD